MDNGGKVGWKGKGRTKRLGGEGAVSKARRGIYMALRGKITGDL